MVSFFIIIIYLIANKVFAKFNNINTFPGYIKHHPNIDLIKIDYQVPPPTNSSLSGPENLNPAMLLF